MTRDESEHGFALRQLTSRCARLVLSNFALRAAQSVA